jgi:thiol-disulfide isomerase/thioredoxin
MTSRENPMRPGRMPLGRLLLAASLALALWGCDDVHSRRRGAGGGDLSPADEVAQLLDENEPFAFDFDLEDVDGNRLAKADFVGKVLIVDIWGTWCGPCRMEIPHFVALDREYRDQGLQIVGLNVERESNARVAAKNVRQARSDDGVSYPCALVSRQVIRQVPDFGGFPTTLFFDRTGKVRLKLEGYHELPYLRAAVEALLKEKPPGESAPPDDAEARDGDGEKPIEK